jgi:hypothetical protein
MCAQLPPKGHVTSTAQQIQNKADLERTCEAVLPVSGGCRKTGGRKKERMYRELKFYLKLFTEPKKESFLLG